MAAVAALKETQGEKKKEKMNIKHSWLDHIYERNFLVVTDLSSVPRRNL